MPKRLSWFGLMSIAYLAMCFAVHVVMHKSTLELSSYRTMVASISGRIHDPMSQYQIDHLSSQLSKLEFGGELRSLGLNFKAKPLSSYLEPATFDMNAGLKLLSDGRLRASQIKFDSLASKIDNVYLRRTKLLNTLSTIAAALAFVLMLMFFWLWKRPARHWKHEIALVDDTLDVPSVGFDDYLQSVVDEEVKFVGHRAKLSCKGFDIEHIPQEIKAPIELIAEQLVLNSIEHGGRPAETRLLAGKTDYISIHVSLQELKESWLLTVWDNGEGLDGDQILSQALNLKLISPSSADSLAPEQRIKLIFLSGFTTRNKKLSIADNDKSLSELRAIAKLSGAVLSVQNKQGDSCQFSVSFAK